MSSERARQRSGQVAVLTAAMACLCGCNTDRSGEVRTLHQELDRTRSDLENCTQMVADRDAQIAILNRQIVQGEKLQGKEIKDLFVVDRIEIASLTGGADLDGQPGDDGVRVYVRPFDADGDALKAAGEVTIQLLDLSTPGSARDLGTYVFNDRETLRKRWYGGLLTNHYAFDCKFQPQVGMPRTRELTIRVTFLDWLTGRVLTDTRTVTISRIDPENALAAPSR